MCRAAGSGLVRGAQRSREARALPPARWAEGWVLRGEGEPPRSILLGVRGALLREINYAYGNLEYNWDVAY